MGERTVKLCTLEEAAKYVEDGMRLAIGGFAVYQKPMAMVHALIRAKRRNLTLVGACHSIDADMMIGAGCISRIETSYVGLEKFGLALNYRRAVQNGDIKVVHYPEVLCWDRFRADREGFPYWPVYFLGGSDIVRYNEEIIPYTCPVTGKPVHALPAAKPDVVIIHAYAADKYGNVQIQERYLIPQSQDIIMARAAKKLIVTAEKIIDTEELYKNPQRTVIASFSTTCVVHVPCGSHPTPTLSVTTTDNSHFQLYADACKTPEGFQEYLDKYVYGTKDFASYLQLAGACASAGKGE
ncbi:MAG: CoA transferase subunit A [Christensenellales bacterium]